MSQLAEDEDYIVVDNSDEEHPKKFGEEPDVIVNLKQWLDPTDYSADSSEYNKHLNAHVKGTGQWIRETEQYREWHDTDETGDLWIRSVPGAGKSVAAADLIRTLKAHEDTPVLYFFFRQIILSNQSPASFLRDACHQLLDFSPVLQTTLKNLKEKHGAVTTLPFPEFFQCLSTALTSVKKVYCVLDAMDEMNLDEDFFISNMLNLGRRHPKSIKLVMTSRQLPYLERHFRDSCVVDLRLDRTNVDRDIAKYVSFRLEQIQSRIAIDDAESIKTLICERGRGLFLYARLMMDECIRDPHAFVSGRLPGGLGEMYSKLLYEHAERSGTNQEFQSLVLGFVTHSNRPLRLIELTSAINSMPNRAGLSSSQDTKACIRNCCGPLLEVCEDEVLQIIHHSLTEYLTGSDVSHVQMSADDIERFPVLEADNIHASIAIVCIQYLSSGVFEANEVEKRCTADHCSLSRDGDVCCMDDACNADRDIRDLTLLYPFIAYAIKFWPSHARAVSAAKSTTLYINMNTFMQSESHDFECWLDTWPGLVSHVPKGFTPLHVAAYCGSKGYVEKLLSSGANTSVEDAFARTPMLYAAMNGRTEIVDMLMQFGGVTSHTDSIGLSAVHMASSHAVTLDTLLRHGADPLLNNPYRDHDYEERRPERTNRRARATNILHDIVVQGYVESLNVLLAHVAKSEITQESFFWAVQARKPQIVEVLLNLPWNVNRKDFADKTAIFHAAKNKDLPTLKLLLAAGADPNIASAVEMSLSSPGWHEPTPRVKPDVLRFNALHAWAGLDSGPFYDTSDINKKDLQECLDLLVAGGCNVNSKIGNGKTALFAWTHYSSHRKDDRLLAEAFVSALLAHGADATVLDNNGTSVLHQMLGYETERNAAELLIAAGANINQQSISDMRTPLMNAAKRQLMDPSLFRDLGADFNLQDQCGNTAFHMAASSWCMEEKHADLWLQSADPKILNNAGQMAVVSFDWGNGGEGRVKAISKMVDLGIDLESRDHRGRTILLQFICKENTDKIDCFVKELLRLGADASATDYDGFSALHLLMSCRLSNIDHDKKDVAVMYDLMKVLVDSGCSINSRNHRGQSMLQILLMGKDEWPKVHIRAIHQLGCDVHGVDLAGRTLLHTVSMNPDNASSRRNDGSPSSKIDYVLDMEHKFDVNAKDNHGNTPLMLAAQVSEINVLKLLQAGADLGIVANLQQNALHYAATAGQPNLVNLFIRKFSEGNLSIDSCDVRGQTPLHKAARSGKIESVTALIAAGADCNRRDKHFRTPLHVAAAFQTSTRSRRENYSSEYAMYTKPHSKFEVDHVQENIGKGFELMQLVLKDESDATQIREVVRALIKAGANPALTDYEEHTAVDVALMLGNNEVAEELAYIMRNIYDSHTAGLAPLATFNEALSVAKRNASKQCLQHLDFGNDRVSLLGTIFSHGDDTLIQELVSLGVPLVEEDGSSALHVAVRHGYTSLVAKALPNILDINAFHPPLLHTCIERKTTNLAMFQLLIDAGVDVNAIRQPNDRTDKDLNGHDLRPKDCGLAVIHRLALGHYSWFPKALSVLLVAGADIELEDHKGVTPLETALTQRSTTHYTRLTDAGYWSEDTLDVLLKHGANVNKTSSRGATPLNKLVANKRDKLILQRLIDHGLDLAIGGADALISAIEASDVEMTKILLEAGADPNAIHKVVRNQKSGRTPLICASMSIRSSGGYHDCAESEIVNLTEVLVIMDLLLSHGCNPSHNLDNGDTTVLHEIAKERGIITEALLKNCDPNKRDVKGRTVLHRACEPVDHWRRSENARSIKILLACGYNIDARDINGDTPLHRVLKSRNGSNVGTLLEHGASVTIKNNAGFAPLQSTFKDEEHYIWSRGIDRETMEQLLKAGASPIERGREGTTILHEIMSEFMTFSVLAEKRFEDGDNIKEFESLKALYQRLQTQGCDHEATDDRGRTPIYSFVETVKDYSEVVNLSPPNPVHVRELFETHNITHVDNDGDGLLHVIARREESFESDRKDGLRLWESLVGMGLDPRLENKEGVTPLDVAAACQNSLILDLYARKD